MEFKGTKQKWIISTNNEEGVLISSHPMSRDICTVWKYDNDFLENQESNANALLMSKAPEMLEMLDRLVELTKSDNIEMPKFIKEEIEQLIKEATEL